MRGQEVFGVAPAYAPVPFYKALSRWVLGSIRVFWKLTIAFDHYASSYSRVHMIIAAIDLDEVMDYLFASQQVETKIHVILFYLNNM